MELPENAGRPLKEGEQYKPLLEPGKTYPEVTPYSVGMGLLMTIIFSAAAAYLGLKVGQVFEAAIPIAILAVGITGALKKIEAQDARDQAKLEKYIARYRRKLGLPEIPGQAGNDSQAGKTVRPEDDWVSDPETEKPVEAN